MRYLKRGTWKVITSLFEGIVGERINDIAGFVDSINSRFGVCNVTLFTRNSNCA